MKKNSKCNKRIKKLVLICVMSALLLTVGTYAWFIGMQTVQVNSFEVKIASVDSLMLSMDGTTWDTSIDVSEANQYEKNANEFLLDDKEGLKPISTIGEIDSTASRLKLFEKGSLTATTGGYRLMASRVVNNTTQVTDGIEYLEGDGYVAFDLFIMNFSGDAYYKENNEANEEAIYLTYDSQITAGSTGTTSSGIENSVRVGFAQIGRVSASDYGTIGDDETEKLATVTGITCTGGGDVTGICRKAQIWEPNENTHVTGAKTWYETTCKARRVATEDEDAGFYYTDDACASLDTYITTNAVAGVINADDYVDVYDGVYNTYKGTASTLLNQVDTFTDTEKLKTGVERVPFMTLAPNSITKVRVYIWIEGQDIDNYDFASLGHSISVNFGFTKERITTGEIDENIKPNEGPSGDVDAEQLPVSAKVYKIGDEISIGEEKFNVISQTDDTVTMLAQYVLNDNYRQYDQSDYNHLSFSDTVTSGWEYTPGPKDIDIQMWSDSPKNYIAEYINYLEEETGATNISGNLITMKELKDLECTVNDDYSFSSGITCANSPHSSWLVNDQYWWTRSARPEHNMHIYVVKDNGDLDFYTAVFIMGIRPTITISKETLENLG